MIEEAKGEAGNFRLGPFRANHLDQMEVPWRIEKVNSKEVGSEIFRAAFGEKMNRNAARVRGDDGAGATMVFDAFIELAFEVKILDHGFNDDVAVFQLREVIVKVSDGYQRGKFRREKR